MPPKIPGRFRIGFRAVLHVSDDPYVFSQAEGEEGGDRFLGHSFRFARGESDFARLAPEVAAALAENTPPFWLPIALAPEDQDDRVRDLAGRGFATVVTLSLRSARALTDARDACSRLLTETPLLLFLVDVGRLKVTVLGSPEESFELTRDERQIKSRAVPKGRTLSVVDLGAERFLLARGAVGVGAVRKAVVESVQARTLDERWLESVAPAEIALAVPMGDAGFRSGRVYTYLPMETPSPFHGHIHAPFATKLDRRALHADVPLNEILLLEAARVAADVGAALARGPRPRDLSETQRRSAVVDLLAWTSCPALGVGPETIRRALERSDASLHSQRWVPSLQGWASPARARRWPPEDTEGPLATITASAVSAAGTEVIDPVLGAKRVDRLSAFLEAVGMEANPSEVERAEWVATVAEQINQQDDPPAAMWRGFYRDLPLLFETAAPLRGKRVLSCSDGQLRPSYPPGTTDSKAKAVFLPPSGRRLEGVELPPIPSGLRKRLALMTDVGWYTEEIRAARDFLTSTDGGVSQYAAADMVRNVAAAVKKTRSVKVREEGLRWSSDVFEQVGTGPFRNISLRVPTVGGTWVSSSDALFSAGWPRATRGPLLDEWLAAVDSAGDEDTRGVGAHRIAPPAQIGEIEDVDAWVNFLDVIGVTRGLPVRRHRLGGQGLAGRDFFPRALANRLGLADSVRAQWVHAWEADGEPKPRNPGHRHRATRNLPVLAGQGSWAGWSDDAKARFAALLVAAVADERIGARDARLLVNHDYKSESVSLPSPLGAFLRHAAWFPVRAVGRDLVEFVRPSEVWWSAERKAPSFLPAPGPPVAPLLTEPAVATLRALAGLGVWGEGYASRAVADLPLRFARDEVPAHALPELVNAYASAWADLVRDDGEPDWDVGPRLLLVARGGQLQTYDVDADAGQVVVPDKAQAPAAALLESLGEPVFAAARGSAVTNIAAAVRGLLGSRSRLSSEVDVRVLVDGEPVGPPSDKGEVLGTMAPAVAPLLLLTAVSLPGGASMTLPRDRTKLVDRFSTVHVVIGERVEADVEGRVVPLPAHLGGALPSQDGDGLVVAVERGEGGWSPIARAVQAAAGRLGRDVLAQPFELAVSYAVRAGASYDRPLTDEETTAIGLRLRLSASEVEAALVPLRGRSRRFASSFAPLAVALAGEPAALALEAVADGAPAEVWEDAVSALLIPPGPTASTVAAAARHPDGVGAAARQLGIELADLNSALVRLGRSPMSREAQHRRALSDFLSVARDAALARLRAPHAADFESGTPPRAYAEARDAYGALAPASSWASTVWDVSQALLAEHVDEHLARWGGSADGDDPYPPVSEVRGANLATLRELAGRAARHVAANVDHLSAPWDQDDAFPDVVASLDAVGVLDFASLSEEQMVGWMDAVGLWPEGVPHTVSHPREAGGPGPSESQLQKAARATAARARRVVPFAGREIDPVEFDVQAADIDAVLKGAVLSLPEEPVTPAHRSPPERAPRNRHSNGPRQGRPATSVDPQKASLIGLLGERAVYLWLDRTLPRPLLDASWKSSYRTRYLGGTGDDGLGADFAIQRDGRTHYLEVKAHLDDPLSFELTPSEVRRAIHSAQQADASFEVVYVSHVSDPSRLRIEFMPNPMAPQSSGGYRQEGQHMTFRFTRDG